MHEQGLSRRRLLQGSPVAVAGAMLFPGWLSSTASWAAAPRAAEGAAAPRAAEGNAGPLLTPHNQPGTAPGTAALNAAGVVGATVAPLVYGMRYDVSGWLRTAQKFNSYVRLPLATKMQKVYLAEGEFFTDPLPAHLTSMARTGCRFIVCVYPSKSTDQRAKLARFLHLLNRNGIRYQAALVNEWNCGRKFSSAQEYLRYWRHYAPVIKAAGVPLCSVVSASSNTSQLAKVRAGFPVNPLPDRYWIDYYATGYQWKLRLGGLLDQAHSHGVPTGIAEFGIGANGVAPLGVWNEYCHYLAGLAPRLPLGAVYWGSMQAGRGRQNVVTGPSDPKIPGIRRVMGAFGV